MIFGSFLSSGWWQGPRLRGGAGRFSVLLRPLAGGRESPLGLISSGVFFFNPVVGHTQRKQVCSVVVASIIHERGPFWIEALKSLNRSCGVVTLRASSVARRAGSHKDGIIEPCRVVLSGIQLFFGRPEGRRGRIGVVKLLRARGGCLGVIRWRAWKAAKGPGELPNER